MARIRGKDTSPELKLRRLLHRQGYRYRVHANDLPGTPDVVFRSMKKAIFVHGCFWHQHEGCKLAYRPKSRLDFWEPKLRKNRERDALTINKLMALGWEPIIVWECELKSEETVLRRLEKSLKRVER